MTTVLPIVWASVFFAAAAVAATPAAAVYEAAAPGPSGSQIDECVAPKLAQLGVTPAVCSDAVFVRRVYLDVLGVLPTAAEAKAFLADAAADKRAALIDRLLERDEYADFWALKWGDALRIKAEFPVNLWPNAAQAYHRWVRAALAANKPYDQFARELLTASGSNFRVGPVNFYRAMQNRQPEGIAATVALTLMGARAEKWPAERLAGMAVFFSQLGYKPTSEWKEEHVFWDPLGLSAAKDSTAPGRAAVADVGVPAPVVPGAPAPVAPKFKAVGAKATFPDGRSVVLDGERDPREIFADWLIAPGNPWFTRSIVNRMWAWLLGRGIVHEPDDLRPDNPPGNGALLALLEREFIAARYDVKQLLRLILNSRTYQASSLPCGDATAETEANFAWYPIRRLDAEVLIDAINRITGTSDLYTSAIPEPFTYIPEKTPAVAIADGSITSPFLALFGRSARATGMMNERDNKPMPAQWLHLLNSSHIQRKIESGAGIRKILEARRPARETAEELYLTILSRLPTAEELRQIESLGVPQPVKAAPAAGKGTPGKNAPAAGKAGAAAKAASPTVIVKRREDWIDLTWALLNSTEFLYRH